MYLCAKVREGEPIVLEHDYVSLDFFGKKVGHVAISPVVGAVISTPPARPSAPSGGELENTLQS